MRSRRYLFLQGNASRFFDRLGHALHARGHAVHRINFNGGDEAFWSLPGATPFRGRLAEWPAFLQARLAEWGITDLMLFGDCRPLHRVAIGHARAQGIRVHVCDEGYLRPNWITVEEGGVNGHSRLRRDLGWFRHAAAMLPARSETAPVENSKFRRAIDDIRYLCWTALLAWRYPHYRTHRPCHKLIEYAGGARRVLGKPLARYRLQRDIARIAALGRPYYLFPLQLEADSQIRYHSGFASITAAIESVIRSFAKDAPADSLLVISEHPLETSLKQWRRIVERIASDHFVRDRVYFIEGGTPEHLLRECRGVVTINSTIGTLALSLQRPVITLGRAIYDMDGLTFQGPLDSFWQEARPADAQGFEAFRRVVAAKTQINGSYFSDMGIELAVAKLLARWSQEVPALMVMPIEAREPAANVELPALAPGALVAASSQALRA
ncbi:MAG TPA: capsular biosynthesis protein [Nevskiaceae bacterium]|nr:capsular biosynthesis protein [Nevskiaceae bacterium]